MKRIQNLSPNVRKKSDQIRDILDREISQIVAIRLQLCLRLIDYLDVEIKALEKEIFNYAYKNHNREMEILLTVPGIGELGAASLIAEICNFKDFSTGDKLASWLGIVPNVYQSADKFYNAGCLKTLNRFYNWVVTNVDFKNKTTYI